VRGAIEKLSFLAKIKNYLIFLSSFGQISKCSNDEIIQVLGHNFSFNIGDLLFEWDFSNNSRFMWEGRSEKYK